MRRARRHAAIASDLANASDWSRRYASSVGFGIPVGRPLRDSGGAGSGARRGQKGKRSTVESWIWSSPVAVSVMLSTSTSRCESAMRW